MSRIFTFITALLTAAALHAATDIPADTVITVRNPDNITITSTDGKTAVSIRGSRNNPKFNYLYEIEADSTIDNEFGALSLSLPFSSAPERPARHGKHEILAFRDMQVGLSIPGNAPHGLGKGWEIGIMRIVAYSYTAPNPKSSFSFGVGAMYRQWHLTNGYTLAGEGDALVFLPPVEGMTDQKATIKSASITVPIVYTQRLRHTFGFSLGVAANFNVCTKASSAYTDGNIRYSRSIDGLHQRILTPDFFLTIGSINNIGIYAKYSPVKFMKRIYGPQFTNFTIGLSLGF